MRSFDEMNRMFSEMDRMFDQFRTTWGSEFESTYTEPTRPALGGNVALTGDAAVTLEDEGDTYVFVMDIPGFEKEDIDLTYHDGALSVRAQSDIDEGTDTYHTRRSRRIDERLAIPKAIVTDEITANYHNGVLEVHLPIVEAEREHRGHHIDIE